MANIVRKIVEFEWPVHEEEVGRRVAKCFGLKQAGKRIQTATRAGLGLAGLRVSDGFWSPPGSTPPRIRDRSQVESRSLQAANYIPPEEIREALRLLVRQNIRIGREDLIQQTSRRLGFLRCGPDLKTVISEALDVSDEFDVDQTTGMVVIRDE